MKSWINHYLLSTLGLIYASNINVSMYMKAFLWAFQYRFYIHKMFTASRDIQQKLKKNRPPYILDISKLNQIKNVGKFGEFYAW